MKTLLKVSILGTVAALSITAAQAAVLQTFFFEGGSMAGWNVVPTTVGNNTVWANGAVSVEPTAFDLGSIQGDWIVRTWNQSTGLPGSTTIITDSHTGVVRTDPFVLTTNASVDFLIGGGKHPWGVMDPDNLAAGPAAFNMEREVAPGDWEMIFTATSPSAGGGQNLLSPASWDASAFAGDTVRFGIYDLTTAGWGHIDVDNIVLSGDPIPEPSSLGLLGMLGGLLILRRRR
jgi:hypothetical protein